MISKTVFIISFIVIAAFAMAGPSEAPSNVMPHAKTAEFSVDLWDWTAPCRDLPTFKIWAADMKKIGVTRIEISAPWNLLEPKPNEYDLSFVADRMAVAKANGMGLRVRINSYYQGATPSWYTGERWRDIDGKDPQGTPIPVSIVDERFWDHFAPLCQKLAAAFKGEDIYFNPFIGIHAELKWADWWSYDAPTLALWKKSIGDHPSNDHPSSRAQWLRDIAGDAELSDRPPIPAPTHGTPDNSPQSKAWIAFRERVWRDAIARFTAALRAGDLKAKISAPLGESYRRQSAEFSNLDYWGLSRGADQVAHSYDFFWHTTDDAWHAAAAVATFKGITGIHNIVFEFDGPALIQQLGYDQAYQLRIADAALSQNAGLKAANYSYDPQLPSTWPVLVDFGKRLATTRPAADAPASKTVLLFISKWANYCYREKTEWLHDAQLGAWQMLTTHGLPVRIICEDNLAEDLSAYRGLYVAFSPPELITGPQRAQLEQLQKSMPSIVELSEAPKKRPSTQPARANVITDQWMTLNYPLAFHWLHGDPADCKDVLNLCIRFLSADTKP